MRHENRFEPDLFADRSSSETTVRKEGADIPLILAAVTAGIGAVVLAMSAVKGWGDGALLAAVGLFSAAVALLISRLSTHRRLRHVPFDYSQAILDSVREPLAVTGLDHALLASNTAYRRLLEGRALAPLTLIEDTAGSEAMLLARQALEARGKANGRLQFASRSGERGYTFLAQRRGSCVSWTVRPDPLDDLVRQLETDLVPVLKDGLEAVGVGLIVVDADNRARYASPLVNSWLKDPDDHHRATPDELFLIEQKAGWNLRRGRQQMPVLRFDFPVPGPAGKDEELGLKLALVRRIGLDTQAGEQGGWISFLATLIDDAPMGLALVDQDLNFRRLNATFEAMTQGRAQIGGACTKIIETDYRDEFRRSVQAALDGAEKPPVEVHFLGRSEEVFRVHFGLRKDQDEEYVVLYVIDTTQQKSLERQFVQAQKMQAVGQLAGGVAHDFNNLLTAILGFCDLLLMRHGAGDQSFSDINQIKQNANRAANLVRQLLAFSRQQTMRPKVIDITDVMAELSNLIRRLIGENIDFELVHGRDPGLIKVDQGQLEQVIINLCVNARDAMPDGGKLRVATERIEPDNEVAAGYKVMPPSHYVLIEVSDTGHGISEENLIKVFEPFFTTKDVGKGTGLGLSTVYGIVKQVGGFVFVESEPGEGATFRVYLPRHRADPAQQKEAKPEENLARDLTGKGTILLVEDEDAVRMFAARALVSKGYDVLEAVGGEQGLEMISTHDGPIDILVTDVVMPNMDGPALVAKARKMRPDMRVIFISGYAVDVLREDLDGEDVRFLPKPFSLKQLAEAVKESLDS